MNIESLKSLLLTCLVLVSLVLTWVLWTYHPNTDYISNSDEVIQDVTFGSKKSLEEVIKPKQILYHYNGKNYGSNEISDINYVYKEVQKGEIGSFTNITNHLSEQQFIQTIHGEDKIELIFPTKVPIQQLDQLFTIDESETGGIEIDRIILDTKQMNDKALTIYLVSYHEKTVYKATLRNVNVASIKNSCEQKLIKLPTYFSYKVTEGRIIYLPYDAMKRDQEMFIINQLDIEKFKNALLLNPDNVKKDISAEGESYIDGSRILKVQYQTQLVRYVNPAIPTNQHSTSGPLIQKSFKFINDHGGWTAPYYLFSWNGFKGETVFRLYQNNIPVFNRDGISAIRQTWGEEDIISYSRALFKINSGMVIRSQPITLLSGEQVRDIIKNTKDIDVDLIKDIFIGYELSIENISNKYINLEPVWVIEYENYYKKIVEKKDGKGGEIIGLE
ncbi:MAG: YycH family regulatory protein [Bacillaceae bacterium]